MTRKAVSKLEVGQSVPSINTLRSLSTVFGVSIEEILQPNWENPKTDNKPKVLNELGSLIKKILEALFTVHKVDRADAKKDKKRSFIFNININIGTNNSIKNKNKTVRHDDDTNDDEDFD